MKTTDVTVKAERLVQIHKHHHNEVAKATELKFFDILGKQFLFLQYLYCSE